MAEFTSEPDAPVSMVIVDEAADEAADEEPAPSDDADDSGESADDDTTGGDDETAEERPAVRTTGDDFPTGLTAAIAAALFAIGGALSFATRRL